MLNKEIHVNWKYAFLVTSVISLIISLLYIGVFYLDPNAWTNLFRLDNTSFYSVIIWLALGLFFLVRSFQLSSIQSKNTTGSPPVNKSSSWSTMFLLANIIVLPLLSFLGDSLGFQFLGSSLNPGDWYLWFPYLLPWIYFAATTVAFLIAHKRTLHWHNYLLASNVFLIPALWMLVLLTTSPGDGFGALAGVVFTAIITGLYFLLTLVIYLIQSARLTQKSNLASPQVKSSTVNLGTKVIFFIFFVHTLIALVHTDINGRNSIVNLITVLSSNEG